MPPLTSRIRTVIHAGDGGLAPGQEALVTLKITEILSAATLIAPLAGAAAGAVGLCLADPNRAREVQDDLAAIALKVPYLAPN